MRAARRRTVCTVTGCVLIFCALALLLWQQGKGALSARRADRAVEAIRTCIPSPQSAPWEDRSDIQMPVLAVDGADYLALLELPAHAATFPVLAQPDDRFSPPAHCSGSIYDGSLVIAASTRRGQFDFYRQISTGDAVYITDLAGNRYACQISDILYTDRLDGQLPHQDAALTLILQGTSGGQTIFLFATPMA